MPGWNMALRFVLELAALAGIAIGAWSTGSGWASWLGSVVAPLIAATAWGVFTVPDDPSRPGQARVPVAGWVRLLLEVAVFGAGALGFWVAGVRTAAWIYLLALIVHHAASMPRTRWLIGQPGRARLA
jgi:hypothetical protein